MKIEKEEEEEEFTLSTFLPMILTLLQTDYIVLRAVNIVFSTMHEESINSAFRSSTLIKKQEAICAILVLLRASPASTSSGARRKKEANLICNV